MTKDKDNRTPKKYNLRKQPNQNYKINSESDVSSDSDSDWDPTMVEDDNPLEFQKFLQKIFPSKNQDEKVNQLETIKKMLNKNKNECESKSKSKSKIKSKSESKSKSKSESKSKSKSKSKSNEKKEPSKKVAEEVDEEVDEEIDTEGLLYENDDGEEVFLDQKNMKFNIVFTVQDNEFTDEDLYDDSYEEVVTKLKKNTKVIVKLEEWEESYKGKIVRVYNKSHSYDVLLNDKNLDKRKWKKVNIKYIKEQIEEDGYLETLNELKKLINLKKNKGNKAMVKKIKDLTSVCEKEMKKKKIQKEKKLKITNSVNFKKLLREKSVSNDVTHFKKIDIEQQTNILERLKKINEYSNIEKPYRLSLIESDIPIPFKSDALKKINMLNNMDPTSGEYYKIKQWVDTFMRIPFNKNKNLSLTIDDGIDVCSDFMESAKKTLDEAVYGLDDAKMQIMQMVGQWISNPNSVGSAIAIVGPPGTGKTTLVKEGISKILQRPCEFLALGGATDSSFLEGHSYTYEGSSWGKVVDILIQSKCMNPVIYFDELDKISSTPKGEEITGILTHLTDTSQNDKFHDKYFSSIDFDLSKCLFIFSYNDESKVNPILKDRMYRITTNGYDKKEKTKIALDYLIPKILKNVNFKEGQIIIPEETLHYMIDNLTDKEKGVRNLKRCIEIIYTKLNLFRLMKPDTELFEKKKSISVKFPFKVDIDVVKKLIKKVDSNGPPLGMYI